jgi:integrase
LLHLTEYAGPVIGDMPVADVELPHVIAVLKPIWSTKTETASRVRGRIEDVLDWSTVNGYRSGDNPAKWTGNLEHALPRPSKVRVVEHHTALPWAEVPGFVARLRTHKGIGARALEFVILTAARSGEVRLATWDEIDLDATGLDRAGRNA